MLTDCHSGNEKTKEAKPMISDSAFKTNNTQHESLVKNKSGDSIYLTHKTDSAFEDKVVKTVMKYKKIQALNHFIDSVSRHRHGVSMMFTGRPHDNINYYYLEVGYDTEDRFITTYSFYIYKKGFIIKSIDPRSMKQISIDKWGKLK